MISVAAIFRRVVDGLHAALPDWHLSPHTFDAFADVQDGAERSHKSFAIAIPETEWRAGRQAPARGQHAASSVQVRWLYRLRTGNRADDYVDALEAEDRILAVLLGFCAPFPNLHLQLAGNLVRRELAAGSGPMLLGEIPLVASHGAASAGAPNGA